MGYPLPSFRKASIQTNKTKQIIIWLLTVIKVSQQYVFQFILNQKDCSCILGDQKFEIVLLQFSVLENLLTAVELLQFLCSVFTPFFLHQVPPRCQKNHLWHMLLCFFLFYKYFHSIGWHNLYQIHNLLQRGEKIDTLSS